MLGAKSAMATLPVKDIGRARDFYENTLGLMLLDDSAPDAVIYRSGSSSVLVYESDYAGTNQATAATWAVGDELGSIVEGLKGKGVAFEHYDLPGVTRDGD